VTPAAGKGLLPGCDRQPRSGERSGVRSSNDTLPLRAALRRPGLTAGSPGPAARTAARPIALLAHRRLAPAFLAPHGLSGLAEITRFARGHRGSRRRSHLPARRRAAGERFGDIPLVRSRALGAGVDDCLLRSAHPSAARSVGGPSAHHGAARSLLLRVAAGGVWGLMDGSGCSIAQSIADHLDRMRACSRGLAAPPKANWANAALPAGSGRGVDECGRVRRRGDVVDWQFPPSAA